MFLRPQHKDEEQVFLLKPKDNPKNCNQSNKVDLGINIMQEWGMKISSISSREVWQLCSELALYKHKPQT